MNAARVLAAGIHVGRKILLPRAVLGAGRRERIVVGVVDPPVRRVHHVRRFVERQHAVPLGGGVGAVHGLGPVELRIALGNEVGVEVGDVAVGVGIERVVGRVGVRLHHLLVLGEVARLGARERLDQRLHRLFHQPHAHPLGITFFGGLPHDRAAMRAIGGELLLRRPARGLVRHDNLFRDQRTLLLADAIGVAAVIFLRDRFKILVDVVDAARGVHPAGAIVEALVDEELSPGQRAVGVEAFLADHLRFFAEEERGMRVDQQLRLARRGVHAGDRDAVGSGRFRDRFRSPRRRSRASGQSCHRFLLTVKRFELAQVDAFDVAADAAFAEAQRHPRFELRDHARLHVRVRGEIEIQALGPRIHQRLQPRRAVVVLRLHVRRIDEQLHPQVAIDFALAFRFGQAALRVDEVGLDAVEVVFGLRIHQPEHDVGVGLAVDVRHAPVVADDRDAFGARLPRRHLRAVRCVARLRSGCRRQWRRQGRGRVSSWRRDCYTIDVPARGFTALSAMVSHRPTNDHFGEMTTRNPINGRRAPGSAAPRVVVRMSCGLSANPPPRITHNASASRFARSSTGVVRIRLQRTPGPLPHVARHVGQAMRAFGARELPGRQPCRRTEVGAIAPRLIAPRITPSIRSARGFFPFRFRGQRHAPAVAQRLRQARRRRRRALERGFEPPAIRERVGPRHKRHRMIRRP